MTTSLTLLPNVAFFIALICQHHDASMQLPNACHWPKTWLLLKTESQQHDLSRRAASDQILDCYMANTGGTSAVISHGSSKLHGSRQKAFGFIDDAQ